MSKFTNESNQKTEVRLVCLSKYICKYVIIFEIFQILLLSKFWVEFLCKKHVVKKEGETFVYT